MKQIEAIFPQNQLNDLIIHKLKEIKQLQNNINLDDLAYTKTGKKYGFCKYSLLIFLERYAVGKLSLENAD